MTNLNKIKGINQFCGPAVLAAITGLSTDECAVAISSVTGQKEIKGVYPKDLIKTLENLRCEVKEIEIHARTLFGVINNLSGTEGFYIIVVPKHYVAIEVNKSGQVYLIDNHTKESIAANS